MKKYKVNSRKEALEAIIKTMKEQKEKDDKIKSIL